MKSCFGRRVWPEDCSQNRLEPPTLLNAQACCSGAPRFCNTRAFWSENLWTDYEYARKACDRTGARIHFAIYPLQFGPDHPHMKNYTKVAIPGLLPYLDDYIMGAHDPFVEDFHWSMDDNRHTESKSPELTEGDVPNLLLFADHDVIKQVRTQATSSAEPAVRRDQRFENLWPGRDQASQARSQG